MKRTLIAFSLMSSLFAATAAYAQSSEEAHVPFAFKAGSNVLPAGDYLIKQTGISNFVTINNLNTGKTVVIMTPEHLHLPLGASSRLIFHSYAGQQFLAAIWSGAGEGRSFSVTSEEKQVRQQLVAQNRSATGTEVMIAMK